MTLPDLLRRIPGRHQRNGKGYMAQCPAHEDQRPSLSLTERDGKILVHCQAGCPTEGVLTALGVKMADLFTHPKGSTRRKHIVATYDYRDLSGALLFQVVRYDTKEFKQRRPDGSGGWIWNLDHTPHVLYNLPDLTKAESCLVNEGEKDCDTANRLGFTATCNPHGAGKWRAEHSTCLKGKDATIICDADAPGLAHGREVARSLIGVAASVRLVASLPQAKDLSNWVEKGGTREALEKIIEETCPLAEADLAKWKAETATPWSEAESMATFLTEGEEDAEFLDKEKRFLARECVVEVFSPRGLGKTLWALWLALECAKRELRVLYIDRDNPRRVVKNRLRAFGADLDTRNLKIITREKCPPLTNGLAWASFPYTDYDVVILDSFDSAAEGVGEQDSSRPSKAIAPILDIARRENGPAVLILGNCIKSAEHSRGSGVIEDRADIVYEVRDASEFHSTGSRPWIEELPPAGAGNWVSRASRRKQREQYRLAFIASKFRIAEEPEPFILEINTTVDPWTVKDVTKDVDREGAEAREQRAKEKTARLNLAAEKLRAELDRRDTAGDPPMKKRQDAEPFMMAGGIGLKRADARNLLSERNGIDWLLHHVDRKTIYVLPLGKKDGDGHISQPAEAAQTQWNDDIKSGRLVPTQSAIFDTPETSEKCTRGDLENVAEGSIFNPIASPKNDPDEPRISLADDGMEV